MDVGLWQIRVVIHYADGQESPRGIAQFIR